MHLKITLLLACLFSSLGFSEEILPFKAQSYPHLTELPGWNKDLLSMHLKLYEGYVKNTNELHKKIQSFANKDLERAYEFAALKRRFGWEFDGMRLHELYFENLKSESFPSSALTAKIKEDFGSFVLWKADFISTGLIRGIGWVILYQDTLTGKLFNAWINEHDTGHLVLGKPILVMDVFEHAYITQFALDKQKYIDLFFESINWTTVNKRFSPEN